MRKASLKLKVRWECFGNLADATWRLKRKKREEEEEEAEKKKRVTVVKWGYGGAKQLASKLTGLSAESSENSS